MTWIALTTAPNKASAVRKRLRRRGESAYIPAIVGKRIIPKGTRTRRKRFVTVVRAHDFEIFVMPCERFRNAPREIFFIIHDENAFQ